MQIRYTTPSGKAVTKSFSNGFSEKYINTGGEQNTITVQPEKETSINCILLKEHLPLGQSIKQFKCLLKKGNDIVKTIEGTTIGHKRLLTFDATAVTSIDIVIEDTKGNALISDIAAYRIPDQLVEAER